MCEVQPAWCIEIHVLSMFVYCETISKNSWLCEQVDLVSQRV